jgi:MoxR-like ATPase
VGTRIYNQKTGEFSTTLGPVFTNLLLADEINRAPAKVQSALLEVMQERQVTIAGETHKVPAPFLVMATQNPIETEGTYPLPEAQVDRFMMKVLVDYPTDEEEFVIAQRVTGAPVQVCPWPPPRSWPRCRPNAAGVCGPVADAVRGEAGGGHAHARESTA